MGKLLKENKEKCKMITLKVGKVASENQHNKKNTPSLKPSTHYIKIIGLDDDVPVQIYEDVKGIRAYCGDYKFENIFAAYDLDEIWITYEDEFIDFVNVVYEIMEERTDIEITDIMIDFVETETGLYDFGVHAYWDDEAEKVRFHTFDYDKGHIKCNDCCGGFNFVFMDKGDYDE